jgi:hypothetical protein
MESCAQGSISVPSLAMTPQLGILEDLLPARHYLEYRLRSGTTGDHVQGVYAKAETELCRHLQGTRPCYGNR